MTFYAFGINYQTAPAEVREAFSLTDGQKRSFYERLVLSDHAEVLLLSTCNRTEVYLFGRAADLERVRTSVEDVAGQSWPHGNDFLFEDEAAVRHVLQVTAGLRSMVLGDAQIVSQVKDAYRVAVEMDQVSSVLHRLVHSAFRAAKRVATETTLIGGATSVSSAAVAMARAYFEGRMGRSMRGATALVIGAGEMGRLAAKSLMRFKLGALQITNRTPERAASIAAIVGGKAIPWEDRHAAAASADIVVVATGAPTPVLALPGFSGIAGADPTLLIDIAVPRNIDPALDDLPGFRVLEFNALEKWTRLTDQSRQAQIPDATRICDEVLAEFVSWMFNQQALQPVVQAIRDSFETIRQQEIERYGHRFVSADRDEVDRLTRSIMQKLLAVPVVRLKSSGPDSLDFARGVRLLEMLFSRPGCDGSAEESKLDNMPEEIAPSCPWTYLSANPLPETTPATEIEGL